MSRTHLTWTLGVVLLTVAALGVVPQGAQGQVVQPAFTDPFEWNSAGPSTSFSNPDNWIPNGVPDNPNPDPDLDGVTAIIQTGVTGGNALTIVEGDVFSPDNMHVYTGAGDAGLVNIVGGELHVGFNLRVETFTEGCCWFPEDRDTSTIVNQTGGSVTVGANMNLGRDNIVPVKAIYNLSGGTLDIGGAFISGDAAAGEDADNASGIMNVSGGTMTVHSDWSGTDANGDQIDNQMDGGNMRSQFNVSGDGVAIFDNPNTAMQVGQGNAGDGRFHVSGNGSLTVAGTMNFGQSQTNGNINRADLVQEGGTTDIGTVNLGGWAANDLDPTLGRQESFFNLSGGTSNVGTLNVGNSYMAESDLTVTGGTLQVAGATSMSTAPTAVATANISDGSVQTGSLVVGIQGPSTFNQSGGTVKVDTDLTLAQTADGSGTYNLSGGVLDMSGGNISFGDGNAAFNFDGGTILNAANINFDLVNNGGTLAPGGSAGATSVNGDYLIVSPNAALEIEIGGTDASLFDKLSVTGSILVDGSLDVSLIDGFDPIAGDSFDILDFAALQGVFSAMNLPGLSGNLVWNTDALLTNGILSVVGDGFPPGDFNMNGVLDTPDIDDLTGQSASNANDVTYDLNDDTLVNSDDVKVWIETLFNSWVGDLNLDGEFNSTDLTGVLASGTYESGTPSVWSQGDFNGDGVTDSGDLTFGLAGGGYELGPKATAAVPEPSSLLVLMPALLLLARMRRRS